MTSGSTDRLIFAPAERRDAVIEVIRSARERLMLSLFRCNDFAVFDELTAAAARGVQIEALITQRAKGGKRRLRRLGRQFEAMGATVWYFEDPLIKYHAKYVVSDTGLALVGTFNLTRKCFKKTCDFGVLSSDAEIVSALAALFHADCRRVSPDPAPSPRLIVGPEDARSRVTIAIGAASRHLRIIDPRVDDEAVLQLLAEKQRNGVRVDLVTGRRAAGLRLHGKLIVVDEHTAIISSMSLSPASLGYRREVAIEMADPAHVGELIAFFQSVAGDAPPAGTAREGAIV
jgi:phosphatidylserine/phosphatidylglycerophosphate/cardiolipin synthase-like enzyme